MATLESSVILYSDICKNPKADKTALVYNIYAIQQSLDNLFATPVGTRAWQPEYGNTFESLLGELMSSMTADLILMAALNDVERWEPRVALDAANSSVTPNYEGHCYDVELAFTIVGLTEDSTKFSYATKLLTNGED